MATIVTRDTGASAVSRPLTISELDNNFINLDAAISAANSAISAITVPKITSIVVTDSSYIVLDDTAVTTSGGYIKITGTGFTSGSQVLIGTVAASSVSFVSSTELRAQVPAAVAGTYVVYVVATDGSVAIRVNGVTFSATPTWSTSSTLGSAGTVNIQLVAVSDTSVSYALAGGSTLPSGLGLSSSGLLSGTITGVTVDTTYNFTVVATDLENQESPKAFSVTISFKDPNFLYVPLLLQTGAASARSTVVTDSAQTPNTVTRVGSPSTGWISPYQTDGYWGNQFPGSSSLTADYNAAFDLAAVDFTIETWALTTDSSSNYPSMVGRWQSSGNACWDFRPRSIDVGNFFCFIYSPSGSGTSNTTINSNTSISDGAWHHLVAVRSGNNFALFVDGVRKATANFSGVTLFNSVSAPLHVGYDPFGATYYNGYLSNTRVVKGTAVYDPTLSTLTVPTSPLTAITNTLLLTCQSNRFKDNSTNAFTLTVNGTPRVDPYFYPSGFIAPAASPGAALFNGSTDYVTSTIPALSGVFTIDFWFYRPTSGNSFIFTIGDSSTSTSLEVYIGSSGTLFNVWSNNAARITSSTLPLVGVWNYIAVTRDASNVIRFYLNGSQIGSDYTSAVTLATTLRIGVEFYGGSIGAYGNHYISNFRISNNIRTVTSVPTASFISDANTLLLLPMSDSNYTNATNGVQNNTFIDSSNYAFPITRNGSPTQGSITPYWPNGQWSNLFATNGDFISVPDSANLELGANNFQMSAWIYLTAYPASNLGAYFSSILSKGTFANTRSYQFGVGGISGTTLGLNLISGSTETNINNSFSFALNTWYAVRFTRVSNRLYLFVNGNLLNAGGTPYTDTINDSADILRVGRSNLDVNYVYQFFGYISNVSVAIGGTGYSTANYTPATTPTVATADTRFLSCQSNTFKDNSVNNALVTTSGTPSVQAFQPFSPTASYTPALYGGSGYFNGSTDYLTYNQTFALGTNSFTLEFWLYVPVNPVYPTNYWLWGWRNGTDNCPAMYLNSVSGGGNNLLFVGGATSFLSNPSSIPTNSWNHIAIVRSGLGTNNLKMYINGVQVAQSSTTQSFTYTGTQPVGANPSGNGALYPSNVYISNFRIVNGAAVYTGTPFAPPTLAPLALTGPASAASYSSTTNVNTTFLTPASLLLNMSNAAIYDAAVQNDVLTVGSAVTDTTTKQWSPSSTFLNGSANYLTMPATPQWVMSGDWTLEAWIYPTTVSGVQIIINTRNLSAVTSPVMYLNGSSLVIDAGAAAVISAGTISINSWQYVAATRSGNSWKLFINGGQVGITTTNTTSYSTAYGCAIGRSSAGENFNGYIQDVRVTKGIARTITASPTAAFLTK